MADPTILLGFTGGRRSSSLFLTQTAIVIPRYIGFAYDNTL